MRERIEQIKKQTDDLLQVLEAKAKTVHEAAEFAKASLIEVEKEGLETEALAHVKGLNQKIQAIKNALEQDLVNATNCLIQISEADTKSIQEMGLDPYSSNKGWDPNQNPEFMDHYGRIYEETIRSQEYQSQIKPFINLAQKNLDAAKEEIELKGHLDELYRTYDKFEKIDPLLETERLQLKLQHQFLMHPKGKPFDLSDILDRIAKIDHVLEEFKEKHTENPVVKKAKALTILLQEKNNDKKYNRALKSTIEEFQEIVTRILEAVDRDKKLAVLKNLQIQINQKKQEILDINEFAIKTTIDNLQQHLVEIQPLDKDKELEALLKKIADLKQTISSEVKKESFDNDKYLKDVTLMNDLLKQAGDRYSKFIEPIIQNLEKLDSMIEHAESTHSIASLTDEQIIKNAEEVIGTAKQRRTEYQTVLDQLNNWFAEANESFQEVTLLNSMNSSSSDGT